MDRQITVAELLPGDRVDLESCPFLHGHPSAEFEYAAVSEIEQETEDCTVVYYQDVPAGAYSPDQVLTIKDRAENPHVDWSITRA